MYKILSLFFMVVMLSITMFSSESNKELENIKFTDATEGISGRITPVLGKARITSGYGRRIHPTTGKISFHDGIDYAAPYGTKLISLVNGKVIFSEFFGAYGYTIKIQSGRYIFQYSHVDPNNMLNIGRIVKRGDIIGRVGPKYVKKGIYKDYTGMYTNGRTTGPHLHFSIKENGAYINPKYFKM